MSQSESRKPILRVDNLVKYFPVKAGVFRRVVAHVKAVDNISFEVYERETLGLVGESGCGKTTAGMTVLRLHEPTSGRIIMNDEDTTHLFMPYLNARKYLIRTYVEPFEDLKRKAGSAVSAMKSIEDEFDRKMAELYFEKHNGSASSFIRELMSNREAKRKEFRRQAQIIFQDPYSSLNPRMRIKNIIAEGALIHKVANRSEVMAKVADILKKVGLSEDHMSRFPHEFSGGQRQRIGIARALILNPKLIVADEAVSALDVSIQAQILNLLNDLQVEFGLTYLFIAHDLAVVRHVSRRVAVMYLGKMVEIASKIELFENPLHPYTVALMSAIPIPDPEKKSKRIILQGDVPSPINPPKGCRFHPRCPIAKDICSKEEPPLQDLGNGHKVACFFPGEMKR
ncbi:oligopeptide/dipeptide ABC transporter ATP-binding protein [Kosmotoga pacifica]|uniref:Peptide ABC transporter ATP-binding protein n=1 Tax=Kosmotoga pacifica TaxID=1330330 RepID=A0A0G2Z6H8_9BACT|nr:oligopeptide/dipeptide ABC transporter ATP-binding protein [Kosmotoga pacifica]AKI97162.1 peptide ABC transporter ATP-binding protein [Kosmotoga pacifica]